MANDTVGLLPFILLLLEFTHCVIVLTIVHHNHGHTHWYLHLVYELVDVSALVLGFVEFATHIVQQCTV